MNFNRFGLFFAVTFAAGFIEWTFPLDSCHEFSSVPSLVLGGEVLYGRVSRQIDPRSLQRDRWKKQTSDAISIWCPATRLSECFQCHSFDGIFTSRFHSGPEFSGEQSTFAVTIENQPRAGGPGVLDLMFDYTIAFSVFLEEPGTWHLKCAIQIQIMQFSTQLVEGHVACNVRSCWGQCARNPSAVLGHGTQTRSRHPVE